MKADHSDPGPVSKERMKKRAQELGYDHILYDITDRHREYLISLAKVSQGEWISYQDWLSQCRQDEVKTNEGNITSGVPGTMIWGVFAVRDFIEISTSEEGSNSYRITQDGLNYLNKCGYSIGSELLESIEVADKVRVVSQGIKISSEERKEIEAHSMKEANQYFLRDGWEVKDVSDHQPYDLHCARGFEILYVEVKGTQTEGEKIILTPNEVDWAQQHPEDMALYLLYSIEIDEGKATNGEEKVIIPWKISEKDLRPSQYIYRVG